MKKTLIVIILLVNSVTILGQDVFAPILQQIEQNSTTLQALKKQMEAEKLQNKTGLTPSNPEIEFAYLWGNPMIVGNRKDFSINQSLDFPTLYIHRNKLSDLQNNSLEYKYLNERMQLLLNAKGLCIELIYNNTLQKMYAQQLEIAQKIANSYEKMLQSGEANRLEYNKAKLNYATMENQLKQVEIQREKLLLELIALNGGKKLQIDTLFYETSSLPTNFEQWYTQAKANNPALQYLQLQVEIANRQIKLSQADNLPKMAIGYMGEFVGEEQFQGISIGVSIPLWQNKNRVKQARAAAIAQNQVVEDQHVRYYLKLKSLYNRAKLLQQNISLYNTLLNENNNETLLLKAFEKGEISLLEYLLEIEYIYKSLEKRAEAERDLAYTLAELTSFTL